MVNSIEEKRRLMEQQLAQYGNLFETGFILTDPSVYQSAIVFVNQSFTKITGYSLDEMKGKSLRYLHGEDTDKVLVEDIDQRLRRGEAVTEELVHYRKDGSPFWCELVIQPILGEDGEVIFISSFIQDITNRKMDESLLEQHKHIFKGISEGKELEALLQDTCSVMKPFFGEDLVSVYLFEDPKEGWTMRKSSLLPTALASKIEVGIKCKLINIKDEKVLVNQVSHSLNHEGYTTNWALPIHNGDGKLSEVLLLYLKGVKEPTAIQIQYLKRLIPVIQMTNRYFAQQSQIHMLAYSDAPTGLLNRHGFLRKLKEMLAQNEDLFVAIVATNEYTNVIDLYGRDAGDDLFGQLATRIEKMTPGSCMGRLSNGSLIYTGVQMEPTEFSAQLRRAIATPFIISGEEIFISLKVGISLAEENCSAEELLRRADVALTNSIEKPGGNVAFYKDSQNEETVKEMTIINELIRALTVDGLDVYLQPKINLTTSEIIGFEALARWSSPTLGQVPPSVFIPIAENIGKIIDLEIMMLKKVLKWQRERMFSRKKMYQVAVNISVDHFFHPSFVLAVEQLAKQYEIPPKYIRLEMTESIGLVDFKRAKHIFRRLNQQGFEVSIDDFGVGYSSLSYLPQLNVSELKIDRSFVNALHEQGTYAVVRTIIQLANYLNIDTVAEGVEEVHQIEALTALGCQVGQGFYYYKPMPLEEVDRLLEKNL